MQVAEQQAIKIWIAIEPNGKIRKIPKLLWTASSLEEAQDCLKRLQRYSRAKAAFFKNPETRAVYYFGTLSFVDKEWMKNFEKLAVIPENGITE